MQDIFVGILCVIVAIAGIWCWWYENGNPRKKDESNIEETKQKTE